MPARKRRRYRNKKKEKFQLKRFKNFFILLIILFFLAFFVLQTEYWDGKSKLSVIAPSKDDVQILVFDPSVEEIVNISIPGDTQAEVSRQLGTWNIKSVWKLGENEGLDGLLLAETATRYFKFPTFAWTDSRGLLLGSSNFASLFQAAITPYKTNLKVGDRIRIALFSLRVKNTKKVKIDLRDSRYLEKTTLVGGEQGYVKRGSIPQRIAAIFTDEYISRQMVRVKIVNASGESRLPEEISEVIEVMGAKVVSIEKKDDKDMDCTIFGKEKEANIKMQRIFGCSILEKKDNKPSGVEITIGKEFAKRY